MHKLPELTYAYNALEPHIDARTMEIHHGKHHAAYVANLNKALENEPDLKDMDLASLMKHLSVASEANRNAIRNNGGGVINHNFFWTILGPGKGGKPAGELLAAIEKEFGSFEKFQEKFENAAMTRFGSGWAWLCVPKGGGLAISSTPNQDTPFSDDGVTPILTIDVWEHAYYLNYQNRRADYAKSFWNVVNWDEVAKLFKAAKK
jgi:superoxide dismutase, Fe-Mn family